MNKNIIGDWGAGLTDRDYGRALAALGVLDASGTQKHQASTDPQSILASLKQEFRDGDRTAIWRVNYYYDAKTVESRWRTIQKDAQALAEGWRLLLKNADHPRRLPRLAVDAWWRQWPDVLDLESLMGWLGAGDTGCEALVLVPENVQSGECRTIWHWPLHVGVPAGAEGQQLLDRLKNIQTFDWVQKLGLLLSVGDVRDACDLLILPTGMAARLAEQPKPRLLRRSG
jgi:hypothetical protein